VTEARVTGARVTEVGASAQASRPALIAWCLFDWANSAYPTVIFTFVFSAFFVRAVAADVASGTAAWGTAMAIAGILTAILSPILGAIADRGGARKPWVFAFSLVCVVAGALLWFVRPDPGYVPMALVLAATASIAFEIATVFYNAMLPDLVPASRIGRWSGWAWGIGYAGGLACLVVALVGFVQADPPWFGLDKDAAEHVRAVAPLTALWFAVFAVPFFLLTPDRPRVRVRPLAAAREGLAQLRHTLTRLGEAPAVTRFLIARLFYTDGLNTLFAFGGIYAAGTFGMTLDEVILFGIALNVTAGLGAAAFGWIDDWIGPKPTVMVALGAILTLGAGTLVATDKAWFWALALGLGIFLGPAQAASRTLMARLAPPDRLAEMFGLFALSGKATAFLGPALLAWITYAFDSQRAGMAVIVVLLALGLAILTTVREGPRAAE